MVLLRSGLFVTGQMKYERNEVKKKKQSNEDQKKYLTDKNEDSETEKNEVF